MQGELLAIVVMFCLCCLAEAGAWRATPIPARPRIPAPLSWPAPFRTNTRSLFSLTSTLRRLTLKWAPAVVYIILRLVQVQRPASRAFKVARVAIALHHQLLRYRCFRQTIITRINAEQPVTTQAHCIPPALPTNGRVSGILFAKRCCPVQSSFSLCPKPSCPR